MTGITTDFSAPFESSYQNRKLGLIRFEVASIGTLRPGKWGEYFIVKAVGADNPITFPARYWPPRFNVGDSIQAPVEISRYDPANTWVNICNFRDAPALLNVLSAAKSAANGPHEDVEITTSYVSKLKDAYKGGYYSTYTGKYDPHYMVYDAKTNLDGISSIRIEPDALGPDLSQPDLQYATFEASGDKAGPLFKVNEIMNLMKTPFPKTLEMKAFNLMFVNKGATYDVRVTDGDTISEWSGFIPESEFPFECTSLVNKIKEMYPEEFSHTVRISGDYTRFDTKFKSSGVWKTNANYREGDNIVVQGLDLPSVADDMKRVTDTFYQQKKYKDAVEALRKMKGYMTYSRAATAFTNLGLEFTEEEYYREIESKLIAENKDYDRGYFDILREKIDDTSDAEWGGNTETGEFIATFPNEKLIVVELPVPNKATYFYRIHDGTSVDEMLARINLASPHNGIKRHMVWQNKTFKDALVWVDSDGKTQGEAQLKDMVKDGIISNENEGLKTWTGYFGRAMHRSYENFTWKLDDMLATAPVAVLTSSGYEPPNSEGDKEPTQNPFVASLLPHAVSGIASGIASSYLGRVFANPAEEDEISSNPAQISRNAIKAFEVFHDQPHSEVSSAKIYDKPKNCKVLGPLKHVIYFCSKWSENENGQVVHPENVDINYIHEWNEEGQGTDAGENCMWVAKSKNSDEYIILGDCEVLDVGITDAHSPNEKPNKLLADYKVPAEIIWLGDCKEIAYISKSGSKKIVRFKKAALCTDIKRKKLYIAKE